MSDKAAPEGREKVATWQFWVILAFILGVAGVSVLWGLGWVPSASSHAQGPALAVYDQQMLVARIMEIEGDDVNFASQMEAMDRAQEIAQGFSERTGMIVVVSGAVLAYPAELDITESLVNAVVEDLYGPQ